MWNVVLSQVKPLAGLLHVSSIRVHVERKEALAGRRRSRHAAQKLRDGWAGALVVQPASDPVDGWHAGLVRQHAPAVDGYIQRFLNAE